METGSMDLRNCLDRMRDLGLASGFRQELATLTICNKKCLWPGRMDLSRVMSVPSRRHFPDEE